MSESYGNDHDDDKDGLEYTDGGRKWSNVDTSQHWLQEFTTNHKFGPYKGHLDHNLDDGRRYQTRLQCNNNNKHVILIQPVDSKVIVVVA